MAGVNRIKDPGDEIPSAPPGNFFFPETTFHYWFKHDLFVYFIHLTTYTTTQLAIKQYTPMRHLKISCQKHKIDSLL